MVRQYRYSPFLGIVRTLKLRIAPVCIWVQRNGRFIVQSGWALNERIQRVWQSLTYPRNDPFLEDYQVSYREARLLRNTQVSLRHFGWSIFLRLPGAPVFPLFPILVGMKALALSLLLLAAVPALAQQVATSPTHSSSSTILLAGVALAGLCFFLAVRAAAKKQKRP